MLVIETPPTTAVRVLEAYPRPRCLSLKLFEYMALGKATVAPDQSNIRALMNHEDDALLFSPVDEGAFDKALLRLINDPALRNKLGAAARDNLERCDFTWSGNAARIEEIAQKLIEQKNDHSH